MDNAVLVRLALVRTAIRGALCAGVILATCALMAADVVPARRPEVERAVAQFREFYIDSADPFSMRDTNELAPDVRNAVEAARTLRADGTWADVDYSSQARSSWPQATHYARMNAMVTVAGKPATAPADRAMLLEATHRAFAHWIAHDYQCPNWWYNEIGTPKAIGPIALLLGKNITADEYRYATGTSLSRYKIRMTGQNKVWLAGNALMLGLLTGDEAVIRNASGTIWNEIVVTTAEGIQPDFSFHQHGPQQQFGNYGMAFAVDVAFWARILRGTKWQVPADKLSIVRNYLLLGQNWISWRGAMDISACGRQLMPHSPRDKAANIARVMAQAAVFDPSNSATYHAFVQRNHPGAANDLMGNRYFWRSDYMVHRRPAFAATLKLSSRRVIGAELVNNENLLGYHLGDGALYLHQHGAEYDDIYPVWDWRKLPGVTCAQFPPPKYGTSQVKTDFVGGVSDEKDGVCVMDYERDGVRAKKAWFFSDDVVVCLGADIRGVAEAGIATTINQSLLRGPVRTKAGGAEITLAMGSRVLGSNAIIEHDGWVYTVMDGGELHLDAAPVTGNWHRVFDNPASPTEDVTKDVFTLWFDHGKSPDGASYSYAIAPVGARTKYRVLENSAQRQVVRLSDAKSGMVFWGAGECGLPDGVRVGVDSPCLVLVHGDKTLVVDPTQKLKSLQLTRDGVTRIVELPTGPLAGTAVTVITR